MAKPKTPDEGRPDAAATPDIAEDAKQEVAQAEAEETSDVRPQTSEEKPKRRGSAETGASKKAEAAPEAPRDDSGAVAVRASAKYVRSAPRKARLVMDHIRGKDLADARAILKHTPRAVAADISKLLESAVANAENNFELDPGDLKIGRAVVDEGPTIKRFRPRAQGRATRINKRTSHMTITLTTGKEA